MAEMAVPELARAVEPVELLPALAQTVEVLLSRPGSSRAAIRCRR